MAYYLLQQYSEAVDGGVRGLSRSPGRNTQMLTHPMLAAAYAALGRQHDADNERAITRRLWPLLDARRSPINSARRRREITFWMVCKRLGFADRSEWCTVD
jgi:hypothetical protein